MSLPWHTSTVAASDVYGTQSPTSTAPTVPIRSRRSGTYARASAIVLYIFQLPAMYGRRPLSGVIERLHSGQRLALEQLERRATARGQVRDLVRQAELGERRRAVAAADHGGSRRLRHCLGEGARACGERRELEGTHGPVPEHRAGRGDLLAVLLRGPRSDVEPHPAVGHLSALDLPALGAGVEAVAQHEVERQQQAAARALGLLERLARQLDALLLDEGVARGLALGPEEREAHRAADEDGLGQLHEAFDQRDLVRDLRPAEHHRERPLRILDQSLERGYLPLE